MVQKIKRPVSFLLAVVMIVGMFAAVPFTASAAVTCPICDGTNIDDLGDGEWYCFDCGEPFSVEPQEPQADVHCPTCDGTDVEDRGDGEWFCFYCGESFYPDSGGETPEPIVTSYRISFRGNGEFSDSTSETTDMGSIIESGSEYVESVEAVKVFNGSLQNGVRLGDDSRGGTLKLNLASPMQVSAIRVVAKKYNTEKSLYISVNGTTICGFDLSDDYNDMHSHLFDSPAEISSITLAANKRAYIKNITLTCIESGSGDDALATAKADAKDALASYKNAADYRPAQQTELTNAINAGNDAIDAAASTEDVATALANAKAVIDAIKTDAQLTAEEAAASTTWDGTIPASAPSGYDETEDPITLDTVDEFVWFFNRVGKGTNFSGKTVVLTTDIDLDGHEFGSVWPTAGYTFNGTFDGQNHTVSNFTFTNNANQNYRWSLFRNVKDATIKNLQLDNVNVSGGTGTGHAALVGMTQGSVTIENVHILSGLVSCGTAVGGVVGQNKGAVLTIKNCSNAAQITASNKNAGGIVGASTSDSNENTAITVENCVNTGDITAANGCASGIYGAIEPSSATPTVVFKDCANEGTLSAPNGNTDDICAKKVGSVTIESTAANEVIAKIDAIGTVEYTAESKAKIDAARDAYDALTDDQKALVTNVDALTTAETVYAALEAAANAHTHDDVTFEAWESTNSLPTAAGNYYLANDVTLSGTWTAPAGVTNLCLNGHTISRTGTGRVISVNSGSTLAIYDCSESGTGKITGGKMTGGYSYGAGIGVSKGHLLLYGGTITGNQLTSTISGGGGVYVDNSGVVDMYGGAITNNSAAYGGAAYVKGNGAVFNFYGGMISGNKASDTVGGGIHLWDKAALNMYGGTMSGNTAKAGAAVQASGGSKVSISGGTITGNNATNANGGALSNHRPNGGDQTGTFNISGNPVITGNTAAGQPSDVRLVNNVKLTVTGPLTEGAEIGLDPACTASFVDGYSTYNSGDDPNEFFTSDSSATHRIVMDGDQVLLEVIPYDITINPSVNGAVSVLSTSVPNGTTAHLDVVPDTGYVVDTLTVIDGTGSAVAVTVTEDTGTIFVMPASDVTVSATFKVGVYNVSAADCNGTVTADPASAPMGETVTVTAVPDEGHAFRSISAKTKSGKWQRSLTALAGSKTGSEGYDKLVDGKTNTKYGPTSPASFIIVKADKAFALTDYSLTTANDTAKYSGRNWKSWVIYGANFAADADAVRDSAQWQVVASVTNDTVLGAANYTKYDYTVDASPVMYQYYKVEILNNKAGSGMSQMSELTMTGVIYQDEVELTPDSEDQTKYTFTMPDDDVVIFAVFDPVGKVTWQNWDGTVLEIDENVFYGETPEYNGETPAKASDAQNVYTFAGWDAEIEEVSGDKTYTATYDSAINMATVDDVIDKIDAIGDAAYTAESKALIDDARAAYDALSDDQKALVTNADALTTAETAYAELEAAALAQAKTDAKAELAAYKNADDYRPAQQTELTNAIAAGNEAIDAAADTDAVATALANAKTAIDAIKTDAQMTAEEAAAALATAKADAKDALAAYKNAADYRPAQQTELTNAINAGNDAIDAAANTDAVATALANAKAAIDAIKTDAQLTEEEAAAALATAKTAAKTELANYKDPADYRPAQQTELTNAINAGNDAIDAATSTDAVATALANAKAAIDAIKTDVQLTAEEAAAALATAKTDAKDELAAYKNAADYRPAQQTELTDAINAGNDAIDAAANTDAVATALANAKAAIDAIKTDAELTAEEEAAALVEKAKDWVSVRIDDQICINFLLAQRDDFESVKIEYIDQDLQTAAKTIVYDDLSELTIRDGHYLIPVVIAPAQIGDTIKATLTVGGQEIEYTISVKEYCEYLIANYDGNDAAAVTALAKATLEYGRAANDYFYGTGFYHQSTITSPYSAEYKEEALHTAKNLTNTLSVTDNLRTKLASAAFMALTQPEFRFYMKDLTEAEAAELNDAITTNVDGVTAKFYKNGDAILLEVEGIKAEDMDKVITITVGDLGTITFSGYDFARMMAKSDDQSIAALGAALYLYGAAAKACFTPNQEG